MPQFCDVALAVPLDMVFTYAIPVGVEPLVGGRVLVPFRQQLMSGIVVELHDRLPEASPQGSSSPLNIKKVLEALDLAPVLDEHLLKLGKWIAEYYLAPIGEVFRTMLPLSAGFKRGGAFRVRDYLAERDEVVEQRLRSATRVDKTLLSGMVRKKWIAREDVSGARDAARLVKVAVLRAGVKAVAAAPPMDPSTTLTAGSRGAGPPPGLGSA